MKSFKPWDILFCPKQSERAHGLKTKTLSTGDCNAVLYDYEKEGGIPINYSLTFDFRSFLFDNELMDMGYVGNSFTWNNGQAYGNKIKSGSTKLCAHPSGEWTTKTQQSIMSNE
ncbi:hypothetical protein LINGRAHAP2_LOCUS14864 [Linum grandiflorum]